MCFAWGWGGRETAGGLALVRQTVLRNLQDRKVKVSPFLLDGIQVSTSPVLGALVSFASTLGLFCLYTRFLLPVY